MIVGLNIPTTYRIAQSLLEEIAGFGFTHVRLDVPATELIEDFVRDYCEAPVTPLFTLHDVALNEPLLDAAIPLLGDSGFWVQVFNPDLERGVNLTLPVYIAGIQAVHHDCRARGFRGPILMGGTANPDASNRSWLSSAVLSMPPDVMVDEHRYAYKTQDYWARPWPRYTDRVDENRTLKRLAAGRDIVRTEIGWHTAVEQLGLGTTQLTDEEATQNYIQDFALYEADGFAAVFVFQLNDGPGDSWGEKQGIRTFDGRWKPQAQAVQRWRQL